MTDTKPSLDEQIDYVHGLVLCDETDAILASLEELKRIREAEMPVDPKVYQQQFFCDDGTIESHEAVLKHDYNALKAYAQRKDAENEALRKLLKDVRARAVEAKLKEKNG